MHILSAKTLESPSLEGIWAAEYLFANSAAEQATNPGANTTTLQDKMAALLFVGSSAALGYTRVGFSSAASRLGLDRIGDDLGPRGTSLQKGESIADMLTVVAGYCDLVIVGGLPSEEVGQAVTTMDKHIKRIERSHVPVVNVGNDTDGYLVAHLAEQAGLEHDSWSLRRNDIALRMGILAHALQP